MILRRTLWVAMLCFGSCFNVSNVRADWYDSFDDGNFDDGVPFTWTIGSTAEPCCYDASSGDLVMTEVDLSNEQNHALTVSSDILADVSVRLQGKTDGAGGLVALARWNVPAPDADPYFYGGLLNSSGFMRMFRADAAPDGTNTIVSLASDTLQINTQDDVLLQFDVLGDMLSLTAWRPGQPKPAPQLTAIDSTYSSGEAGIAFASSVLNSSGTFRFAEAYVPEPSAFSLSSLGLMSLIAWRRRQTKC